MSLHRVIALGAGIVWFASALVHAGEVERAATRRIVAIDALAARAGSAQSGVRWTMRATLTAGEVPGDERVDLDSSGHMSDQNSVLKFQCAVDLSAVELEGVESALVRAHPELWREKYFPPDNPDGADELQMILELTRADAKGRPFTHRTRWMIATGRDAPTDAMAVWNAIWQARRFCLAKK